MFETWHPYARRYTQCAGVRPTSGWKQDGAHPPWGSPNTSLNFALDDRDVGLISQDQMRSIPAFYWCGAI